MGQCAAAQEDHVASEPAAMANPAADLRRIDLHQHAGAGGAEHRPPVRVRLPGGMEAERGPGRDADLLAGQEPEDQGAGRQAGPVNDDALAGMAQSRKAIDVGSDASAAVAVDPYSGRRGRRCRLPGVRLRSTGTGTSSLTSAAVLVTVFLLRGGALESKKLLESTTRRCGTMARTQAPDDLSRNRKIIALYAFWPLTQPHSAGVGGSTRLPW